jgi:hypothetical protein
LSKKKHFEQNPEIKICGTWVAAVDELGSSYDVVDWFNRSINLNDPKSWIWQNRLCHSSVAICSSTFEKIGFANEALTYTPDWERWIRALILKQSFFVIEKVLTFSRQHSSNITHKNPYALRMEWATISKNYLHPYLFKENMFDLVALNFLGFYNHDLGENCELSHTKELILELMGVVCLDHDISSKKSSYIYNVVSALVKHSEYNDRKALLSLCERDTATAERDMAIAERDAAIAERDAAIAERDVVPRIAHLFFLNLRRLTSYFKKT